MVWVPVGVKGGNHGARVHRIRSCARIKAKKLRKTSMECARLRGLKKCQACYNRGG